MKLKFSEWLKLHEFGGGTGPYILGKKDKGGSGCGKHTDFQVSGACSDANTEAGNEKIRNGGSSKKK